MARSMSPKDRLQVPASWGAEGGSWAILVHGGAGRLAPDRTHDHMAGCRVAAALAGAILRAGGTALDAVEHAVSALEDDPQFNAGTGACLNAEGLIELDAAIMEGSGLRAGGVCALPPFRHPIAIARAMLNEEHHVLFAGDGAARFAISRGFERVTSDAMTTDAARVQWESVRAGELQRKGASGTVGAVARDCQGHLAAATSTGGIVNKRPGRVGDSPLLGAGTYADDDAGACSATGMGEAIMRLALAKGAVDALRVRTPPQEAAHVAIHVLGTRLQADGGVILIDPAGRIGLARNTPTMAWGAEGELLALVSGI